LFGLSPSRAPHAVKSRLVCKLPELTHVFPIFSTTWKRRGACIVPNAGCGRLTKLDLRPPASECLVPLLLLDDSVAWPNCSARSFQNRHRESPAGHVGSMTRTLLLNERSRGRLLANNGQHDCVRRVRGDRGRILFLITRVTTRRLSDPVRVDVSSPASARLIVWWHRPDQSGAENSPCESQSLNDIQVLLTHSRRLTAHGA